MSVFDKEIMARTAIGEARGEGEEGMQAVMWTGLNRFNRKEWFSAPTIAGTFLKREQYSCWNPEDVNYSLIANLNPDSEVMVKALLLAAGVLDGSLLDPTDGCTHYLRTGTPSAWSSQKEPVKVIGNHSFYNNIN